MNRPPDGTKCIDCGCCQADLYAGDAPICWACDANELCKGKRTVPAPPKFEAAPPAPVAAKPQPSTPSVVKEKPMTAKLTEKQTAQVLSADVSISNASLGRELGVSAYMVMMCRAKAGIRSEAKPTGRSISKSAAVKAAPKRATTALVPAKQKVTRATPMRAAVTPTFEISLQLTIDAAQAERILQNATPDEKTAMLHAVLTQRLCQY